MIKSNNTTSSPFGHLCRYSDNETLRPATLDEAVRLLAGEGAVVEVDGLGAVYCLGVIKVDGLGAVYSDLDYVSNGDIRDLRTEAGIAGDIEMADMCVEALGGSKSAKEECIRVILETRANLENC